MKLTGANKGINLYEGYLALVKKERAPVMKKSVALLMPVIALLLVLAVAAGVILMRNGALVLELSGVNKQIAALEPAYDEAETLEAERDAIQGEYAELAVRRAMMNLYPELERKLFEKVRACAGDIFVITQYDYAESDRTLTVEANASSVNEVPGFVERLRDTGLFRSVQYVGYTSDSMERYYCTVGCTLLDTAEPETTEQGGASDE